MSVHEMIGKIQRGLRKPPGYVVRRVNRELIAELDRFFVNQKQDKFDERKLISLTGAGSVSALWKRLASSPYVCCVAPVCIADYEQICPGDADRIDKAANQALAHTVDLLGSGKISLGENIQWNKDYKTGISWPDAYFRDIEYSDHNSPSDVKFPWEVSRMQWLIPVGQSYLLTGEERYAQLVRSTIESWIKFNPYAASVNWVCAMEVSLRIIVWSWFFHVFKNSASWQDPEFQHSFLSTLYLHAEFTERYIEESDINGNHFTANAAGLVFAGHFFGAGKESTRWTQLGWEILGKEIQLQVNDDGCDFEGSISYHRLVFELFFLAAHYRRQLSLAIASGYDGRLMQMANYIAHYTRTDGSAPYLGDADDARVLPFGGQPINDHRYTIGWTASVLDSQFSNWFSGPRSEVFWLSGQSAAMRLPSADRQAQEPGSKAFSVSGYYVMRNRNDHVFIDCAPVGLAGRGGHGHNDCLSFEAVLDGIKIISDCGSFVYTADYEARNRFRSTSAHNTPMIDEAEINRFSGFFDLWTMKYDAVPFVRFWGSTLESDCFSGGHLGYNKLPTPIVPIRKIQLDHRKHSIAIKDEFECLGKHRITIPLHIAPGISVKKQSEQEFRLSGSAKTFALRVSAIGSWMSSVEPAQHSPRYGVVVPTSKIVWQGTIEQGSSLEVVITPA